MKTKFHNLEVIFNTINNFLTEKNIDGFKKYWQTTPVLAILLETILLNERQIQHIPYSSSTVINDVLRYSISYIDSKCHIRKLKSTRTCLIGYSDFISREWFFIAWGQF